MKLKLISIALMLTIIATACHGAVSLYTAGTNLYFSVDTAQGECSFYFNEWDKGTPEDPWRQYGWQRNLLGGNTTSLDGCDGFAIRALYNDGNTNAWTNWQSADIINDDEDFITVPDTDVIIGVEIAVRLKIDPSILTRCELFEAQPGDNTDPLGICPIPL